MRISFRFQSNGYTDCGVCSHLGTVECKVNSKGRGQGFRSGSELGLRFYKQTITLVVIDISSQGISDPNPKP